MAESQVHAYQYYYLIQIPKLGVCKYALFVCLYKWETGVRKLELKMSW